MNIKTINALEDSIEHWRRFVECKSAADESIYTNDCALCKLFYDKQAHFECYDKCQCCNKCPVKARTGFAFCKNSPWKTAYENKSYGKYSTQFLAAALLELNFLISLREDSPLPAQTNLPLL